MTDASDENMPDANAMTIKPLPEPENAEKAGSLLAANVDGFGLPKGQALADAIDEIALRLKIPQEHAREIARRAIAKLQAEISRRGMRADDMPAAWVES